MNFSLLCEVQNMLGDDCYIMTMTAKGKTKRIIMSLECSRDYEYILKCTEMLLDSFKYMQIEEEE